ncbi:MAG: IS630 family transposase [Sphingobacteriales bacterium]
MARPARPIQLSQEEINELQVILRSTKAESRIKVRAGVIWDWYEGKTYDQTQELFHISRRIVSKWRTRFLESRMNGLTDAARIGKPVVVTEAQKNKVIHLACSKPEKGYTNWSQARIGAEVGISQSKVFTILKEQDLKPHKIEYWCGKSTDPEFEAKMLNIVGLYMNPPENAIVLCVDEKTQIQALDRSQPELPLRHGNPKRLTATYKRNGVVNLIASLAVHQGEIIAQTIEKNNSINFLGFLKKLAKIYKGKPLHIIADNLSVHKHESIKKWVEKNKNINLHYTPTYSSWLNMVEIWFNILSKDVLKGGVWHSKQQLVNQLLTYIETYNNERAKPFEWTYAPISSPIKELSH